MWYNGQELIGLFQTVREPDALRITWYGMDPLWRGRRQGIPPMGQIIQQGRRLGLEHLRLTCTDESLRPFWDAARSHGAVCIFASPVAMREFDEAGVCYPSFAAYREAMRAFAAEVGAPFIDLGAATAAANTAFGAERCKARYMWVGAKQDNAHQQNAGACRTAQAFVQQLLQDTTPALDVLRANFK